MERIEPIVAELRGIDLFVSATADHAAPMPEFRLREDQIALVMLHEGLQIAEAEAREYTVRGGDMLVIQGDMNWGLAGGICYASSFHVLVLNTAAVSLLGLDAQETAECLRRICLLRDFCYAAPAKLGDRIAKAFDHLCAEDEDMRYMGRGEVLQILFSMKSVLQPEERRTLSPVIRKAIDYINDTITANPTLPDIAEMAGISLSYFKSQFRMEVGMTPQYYINWRRIAYGKRLIAQNYSISEAAMLLSFSSTAYFTTVFRMMTSRTPAEYKKLVDAEMHKQQHKVLLDEEQLRLEYKK